MHHSIELFHQPNLMYNFYWLTICLLHYYPRHVSSIKMPIFRRKNFIHTASGIFALCKRLPSTLVGSGLYFVGISWCYLPSSACFIVPGCCLVLVQFYFCVLILVNRFCLFCIMQFDVSSTVHHSIELFRQPNLMYNFYSLTVCLLHYYPDMFRTLTCPSSGGKIVFTQHLVSSLSVNVCPVHWLRAGFIKCLALGRIL